MEYNMYIELGFFFVHTCARVINSRSQTRKYARIHVGNILYYIYVYVGTLMTILIL